MPLAPTPLQSLTSRRNGALSHGPTSAAGRALVARNATRHGLRAGGVAVRPEEAAWYAELLADHLHLYAPQDEAERSLVEQLVLVELKLARLDLLELTALDDDPPDGVRRLPSLATLARYRARIAKERWELEHRLAQLAQRRSARDADLAEARRTIAAAARTRALGSLALSSLSQSGLLAGLAAVARASGTNEPERRATPGPAACTNEPEARAGPG